MNNNLNFMQENHNYNAHFDYSDEKNLNQNYGGNESKDQIEEMVNTNNFYTYDEVN